MFHFGVLFGAPRIVGNLRNGRCIRWRRGRFRSGRARHLFHIVAHFARVLVTAGGFLFQSVQDDVIEPHIHLRLLRGQLKAAHRRLAREHFVDDHAERIEVRAMIDRLRLVHLLGSHVTQGAERHAGEGECHVERFAAQQLGQAEVGDLHAALFVEEQVLGLDVAVHEALLVRVFEGVANLRHDGQRLGGREPARLEKLPEIHAVHILHDDVVEAARFAEVVDINDVRMVELGEGARLAGVKRATKSEEVASPGGRIFKATMRSRLR